MESDHRHAAARAPPTGHAAVAPSHHSIPAVFPGSLSLDGSRGNRIAGSSAAFGSL